MIFRWPARRRPRCSITSSFRWIAPRSAMFSSEENAWSKTGGIPRRKRWFAGSRAFSGVYGENSVDFARFSRDSLRFVAEQRSRGELRAQVSRPMEDRAPPLHRPRGNREIERGGPHPAGNRGPG